MEREILSAPIVELLKSKGLRLRLARRRLACSGPVA
jgi:hypothetical protein